MAGATRFNPNASTDGVRLHVECRRRYDPDVDTGPVDVGPARSVTLSANCRQEIDDVWVTHDPEA